MGFELMTSRTCVSSHNRWTKTLTYKDFRAEMLRYTNF